MDRNNLENTKFREVRNLENTKAHIELREQGRTAHDVTPLTK